MKKPTIKIVLLIISCFALQSCATAPPHVASGQKKPAFNPNLDSSCVQDDTISKSSLLVYGGFACGHNNGVVYVKHTFGKWALTKSQLDLRAGTFCQLHDRKARFLGKATIGLLSKLDWTGFEYTCE